MTLAQDVSIRQSTQDIRDAVKRVKEAFDKKKALEQEVATLIYQFEKETGLVIDSIHYERDITMPLIDPSKYTAMSITINKLNYKEI